jgi:UDP:flavonoid glycosyltransferase YjiC (YdhE family)
MQDGARQAAAAGGTGTGRLVPRGLREQMVQQALTQAGELLHASQGHQLLTGGVGGSVLGVDVAEKHGIPFLYTHLQPVGTPTWQLPGVLTPWMPTWLGPLGRRAGQSLTQAALSMPLRPVSRAVRRDVLGLPARARQADPALPSLYGFSPHVVPPPSDWPPTCRVTGYWFLPAETGWTPPPALTQFLADGPAPVCVGFGSMLGADPAQLTALVVTAVRRAGVRAVLLSGWGGLDAVAGEDILVIDEVPHDWLFPQVAAVVHHGGAGTTAAALRAGTPAVVVPFGVDQPFWGTRVAALGTGPRPIPQRTLTTERLADALRIVTTDETMRARAAHLGHTIRSENGVDNAVAAFHDLQAHLDPA